MIYYSSKSAGIVYYYLITKGVELSMVKTIRSTELSTYCSINSPLRVNSEGELEFSSISQLLVVEGVVDSKSSSGRGVDSYVVGEIRLKGIELLPIKEEDYLKPLYNIRPLVSNSLYEFLYSKYGERPLRLHTETLCIVDIFKEVKRLVDLSDYVELGSERVRLLNLIGNPKLYKALEEVSDSEVWLLLNRPTNKNPILDYLFSDLVESYKRGESSLRVGLVLLNEWLINHSVIDKKDPRNWNIQFRGNSQWQGIVKH